MKRNGANGDSGTSESSKTVLTSYAGPQKKTELENIPSSHQTLEEHVCGGTANCVSLFQKLRIKVGARTLLRPKHISDKRVAGLVQGRK